MSLLDAAKADPDDLLCLTQRINVVKVFYVWTGRNAWWSTWSTTYSPGCFHRTLKDAKAYCESRRTQGTVFFIDELPSLGFFTSKEALLISEINTERFFSRYNAARLTTITEALPVASITLRQFWHLFKIESPLWPADYPKRNSAFASFEKGGEPFEIVEKEQALISFKSSSNGSNYYLGWYERPFSIDRATLHAMCDALNWRYGKF
jgi:hypothetical protein